MMKQYVLLCLLLVAGVSCSRKKSETTNIVFEIPAVQHKASGLNLLDFEETADDDDLEDNWSSVVPTGITTGDYPINCYAVMVSGPESNFRESTCGRKTTTTVAGTTTTTSTMTPLFQFGPWVGGVYASAGTATSVQLEVPAGNDRVFRLIGFHALTPEACTDFKTQHIKATELSKPHIIGVADRVALAPGATATISITQTLRSEDWFDKCEFKDINNEPKEAQADSVGIKMVSGITENAIETLLTTETPGTYKCELYKIHLMDKYFKPANHDQEVVVRVSGCMNSDPSSDCDPDTQLTSFIEYENCATQVSGTGQQSFKLGKNIRHLYRWIRSPVYGPSFDRLHNAFLQATATVEGIEMQKVNPSKFRIRELTNKFVKIDGPKNLIKDGCYKYTSTYSTYSGGISQTSGTLNSVELWAEDGDSDTNISSTHLFNNSSCSSAYILPAANTWTTTDFYIKAPSASKLRLKVIADTATEADESELVIKSRPGTFSPRRLRFNGPNTLESGSCKGPFSIQVLNENNSVIISTAANSVNVKLKESSPIAFYSSKNSNGCLGLINMESSGLTIPIGSTDATFYLKTNASSDRYIFTFTDGNSIDLKTDMFVY
jgi:hypothetical protein